MTDEVYEYQQSMQEQAKAAHRTPISPTRTASEAENHKKRRPLPDPCFAQPAKRGGTCQVCDGHYEFEPVLPAYRHQRQLLKPAVQRQGKDTQRLQRKPYCRGVQYGRYRRLAAGSAQTG